MIDYKAEAEQILEDEHVESSVDAIVDLCRRVVAEEREGAAKIAEDPYGDEVEAFGGDEPKAVGRKIAAAIRRRAGDG